MRQKSRVLPQGALHDLFIEFWNELSARYGNAPNVLFDPINGPYFDKALVTNLLKVTIAVIRKMRQIV